MHHSSPSAKSSWRTSRYTALAILTISFRLRLPPQWAFDFEMQQTSHFISSISEYMEQHSKRHSDNWTSNWYHCLKKFNNFYSPTWELNIRIIVISTGSPFWQVPRTCIWSSLSAQDSKHVPWNDRYTLLPLPRDFPCVPPHTSLVLALKAARIDTVSKTPQLIDLPDDNFCRVDLPRLLCDQLHGGATHAILLAPEKHCSDFSLHTPPTYVFLQNYYTSQSQLKMWWNAERTLQPNTHFNTQSSSYTS